jgi:hypothetical protein
MSHRVQVLSSSYFSVCCLLSPIYFEIGSEWMRIQSALDWVTCFCPGHIPGHAWFIAENAFPFSCLLTVFASEADPCQEFMKRIRVGQSGSKARLSQQHEKNGIWPIRVRNMKLIGVLCQRRHDKQVRQVNCRLKMELG